MSLETEKNMTELSTHLSASTSGAVGGWQEGARCRALLWSVMVVTCTLDGGLGDIPRGSPLVYLRVYNRFSCCFCSEGMKMEKIQWIRLALNTT